jgi:N-acetylmuramoyl-L-alanine amidase
MKNIYKLIMAVLFTVNVQSQIIVIDPGHGYGATTSNNPDGRTAIEIETSLEVGLRTRNLIQNSCIWTVQMTRTTNLNSWISVTQRGQMANNWNADRLLSIHCNAGGGTGTETFYCTQDDTNTAPDIAFAQKIQSDMVSGGSWNNRRCVEDNTFLAYHLGVLRYSSATGCLNEIGFVDSADASKLTSSTWRDAFALSYFNALKTDLNITCAATPAPGSFTLTVTPECNATTSRMALSWTASANATSYDIYKDGALWDSNITTTSYTNTNGVVAGSAYTYSVKAKNAGSVQTINSNGTVSVTALNCAVPGAFTMTVTPECSASATPRNKLTWTASANATAYNVYRNGVLYASSLTGTTYTNTAVTSGTTYSYYVVAKNATATQTTNSNGTQTVIALNCAIPGSFTLNAVPECNGITSQVALNWTASANATSYDLYRNDVLYAADIAGTTYTNTAVTSGVSYTYFVKAKNTSTTQTSNSNGTLSVTTLDCNPIPGAFTLTVTPECSGTGSPRNKLSWTASSNATAYNVYRNGVLYASSISGTTYTNTAVTTGTTYTYYVKAKNATATQTTNSNGTQTVVALNCAAPGAFTISAIAECSGITSRINLTWTASTNASSYDVYRNGSLYASDVTGTQFLNTYITVGSAYTYSMIAKNNIGTLANSNGTISATAIECAPGAFTMTASPTCSGTTSAINLTWTAAANATSYDIYRNGNLYASDVTGTSFLNTYLITAGTSYSYYVKAKNTAGTLNNSNGTLSVTATNCSGAKVSDQVEVNEGIRLSFFPNPTDGILNLEINKSEIQKINYMIIDLNGRIIKEANLETERTINLSKFPAATYFVRVLVDGQEFVKQIVKK